MCTYKLLVIIIIIIVIKNTQELFLKTFDTVPIFVQIFTL